MDEPTLLVVEAAIASRAPATAPHPIRDELLPRLDEARTLDDVERAIHGAGHTLAFLGAALVADPRSGRPIGDSLAPGVLQMLAVQDELERVFAAAAGDVAARQVLVAHETLRRFLMGRGQAAEADGARAEFATAAKPSVEFLGGVALRLALLVVALEHLVARGGALIAPLADKAFETSQTLRGAARDLGLDLTPWIDAPSAMRTKRILEAARGFWGSLDDDRRRAVGEAWDEHVEIAPRWPPQPS